MKTTIFITGGNGGNFTLMRAIATPYSVTSDHFTDLAVTFGSKKEAVKALSEAFQYLKSEEPEYYRNGGISYSRSKYLSYDASTARIS